VNHAATRLLLRVTLAYYVCNEAITQGFAAAPARPGAQGGEARKQSRTRKGAGPQASASGAVFAIRGSTIAANQAG